MPDPAPAPPADLEARLRAGLADLVDRGPDPARRADQIDARTTAHRGAFARRRRFLAGAAATTVAAGAGATWRLVGSEGGRLDVVTAGPPSGPTSRSASDWHPIGPAPLSPRRAPAVAWAGDRLIVWGGTIERGGTDELASPPDGAAWLPADQRWRAIATAKTGALADGFAVWDGSELLVGMTEADSTAPWNADASEEDARYGLVAYDPAQDSWRNVAPLASDDDRRAGSGRQAVVVGSRLLVAVRSVAPGPSDHEADVVLVDPATGDVSEVAPGPFAASPYPDSSGEVTLTSVGDLVVAIPNWDSAPWVLDLDGGGWRRASAPPGASSLHLMPATSIGDRAVCFEGSQQRSWAFDPSGDGDEAWQQLAPNPVPLARWRYDPVWSGEELFVPGAAYDPASDTWRPVTPPPRGTDRQRDPQARWAGDALVLFGGEEHTCPDDVDCDRMPGPDTLDGWSLMDP